MLRQAITRAVALQRPALLQQRAYATYKEPPSMVRKDLHFRPIADTPYKGPVKIDLVEIEEKWEQLPANYRLAIIEKIHERMKGDWNEMTMDEKKAAWWVAYGEFGIRRPPPPGFYWRVFGGTLLTISGGIGLFALTRQFAEPFPDTISREYQEATNKMLREYNADPITGISSENYNGPGHVMEWFIKD